MCCDTKEKAKTFLKYLDRIGRKWNDGRRYLEDDSNMWGFIGHDLYFFFNKGLAGFRQSDKKDGVTLFFDMFDWTENDSIQEALQKVEDARHKESHEFLQGKKTGPMVNHPDHYQGNNFEVIDIIEDFNLNFSLGSAIKYILRAGKKDDRNQDLEKAIWYLQRELK